ncbi:MAG: T9SS type A sorting domain-containing protein, partial [Spirochaetales bacterium]|nr:T9SS type A sorting domain-containing protein [Spirochaetales bacterium]
AHNYFELKYSEPVDFGTGLVNDYLQSGTDDGTIDDDDLSRRATNSFAVADERGAYIYDDDPGATGSPGTVFVEGYFSYAGEFDGGSVDADPATSALYRYPGLSSSDTHHLRIFIKGWSEDLATHREWKGYVDNATDPVGETISVPANPLITDDSGASNAVLSSTDPRYVEPDIAVTTLLAPFDWPLDFDPPAVALFRPNNVTSPYREIYVTLDLVNDPTGSPDYYNRLEFHIQDNFSELETWVSSGAPAPDHPDTRLAYGIRDYAVRDAIGSFFVTPSDVDFDPGTPVDWRATVVGNDPPLGPPPLGFYTTVDNYFYTGGPGSPANDLDDSYFSLMWDNNLLPQLQVQTSIWVAYQPTPAVTNATEIITDLAGNRLPGFERYANIEREPPTIVVALAAAGADRVYIRFSEPVGEVGPGELQPGNIVLTDAGGLTVSSIEAIKWVAGPGFDYIEEAFLNLSGIITADTAFTGRLGPSGADVIEDPFATGMDAAEINRLTDVGIDIVVPVEAWNDIQNDDAFGDEFMGVQLGEFDGGVALLDEDITLQASILATSYLDESLILYYDAPVGDEDFLLDTETLGSDPGTRVWLPVESPLGDNRATAEVMEFLPRNDEARRLTPTTSSGALREYAIPANDPEITEGATLEFVFTLGGLPVVTAADPADPRTLMPWSIGFRRFIEQRSGVTILNNVIYPENGDQTVLTYEVPRAGMVTIQVFTLDGRLVKSLVRGRQGEGRQIVSWNGINASGQIVASGLYFIRVVGPDIDEIRKVLVAK